ncbi:acetylxylan esterase [Catenulispora subtropica]|uniref:Acetylxylan esterase n=1 Tax=Catenulispora subtropica TaxID=450798 RepID=A0ABP5EQW5_9ACTN
MEITKLSQSPGVLTHPYPFDPTYGLDLEGLLRVPGPDNAPADFSEFWQRKHRRAMDTAVEARLGAKVGGSVDGTGGGFDVFEVSYTSVGGVRIGGWLVVPTDGVVDRGFVIGHGYGGREAPDAELPAPRAAAIFPVLRGLPTKSLLSGVPSESLAHVLQGIESHDDYIIGGCVADLWCAATALTELVPAAARRLDYLGESFGGGTGMLALAWDERFTAAQVTVPTFGNHPLRVTLDCVGSGEAVRARYESDPRVLDVLAYFDAATAARYVNVPVQAAVALLDPSVPPPGQFAIVNALGGEGAGVDLVDMQVLTAGHYTEYAEFGEEEAELWKATQRFFGE